MDSANLPPRERLVSLDVFRGITIAAMLLVNDPGDGRAVYWPLAHAEWHGWTPADLVFPFFLFIVGITTELSLAARRARGDSAAALRRQVMRRALVIFLLGVVIHWFPFYTGGDIPGDPGFLARVADSLLNLRLPGVLQRIAVCYLAGGLLAISSSARTQLVVLAALLLGYWALLMLVPVPGTGAIGPAAIAEPGATLPAFVDRALLDWGGWGNHLWGQSRTWDPEGVLSTLPAIGTVILGLAAGRWIARSDRTLAERVRRLLIFGVAGIALGLAWDLVLPINKKLWTSSFVLFTGGAAAAVFAMLTWAIEIRSWRRWAEPFRVFGVNPILAYGLSELTGTLIYERITVARDGTRIGLAPWFTQFAFAFWLPPKAASLAFALLYVAVFYLLLREVHRRGIIVKA